LKFVVAVTGASGAIYAQRFVEILCQKGIEVHLVVSEVGRKVIAQELAGELSEAAASFQASVHFYFPHSQIVHYHPQDLTAPMASGSYKAHAMVVIPCSMGTLSRIAHGASSNLIERAADVFIKEKRPLILVPRETPLSVIHLQNMLILAKLGVQILPAMPAFYHKPKNLLELVDFIVGKACDLLDLEHSLYQPWSGGS